MSSPTPSFGVLGSGTAPKLASNPFGNTSSGIIGAINNQTGLAGTQSSQNMSVAPKQNMSVAPTSENGTGTVGPLAPGKTSGISHTIAPDGTITTNTGSNSGTGTTAGLLGSLNPTQQAAVQTAETAQAAKSPAQVAWETANPGQAYPTQNTSNTSGVDVTNPTANANNVLTQSNLQDNPTYQALENQNNILNTAATESARAGGAGGFGNTLTPDQSGILGPDYTGQFNPNASPEMINAEKASESPYLSGAIAGNAAEQANIINAAQVGTQGAENVLGTSLSTQVAPGNTNVSQLTQQPTYGLGTGAGGNGANAYQNFSNLQFNTAAGQQFSQQANTLSTAAAQTTQNFQTLQKAAGGINLSDFPSINAASQFLQSQGGNAGAVSALNEAYNALQTSMANIISSGGSGLTPTQITSLTNGQNISSLSPEQLTTLYNTVQQTMATKISTTQQQAIAAENAGTSFNNSSTNTGSNPYADMVQ